MTALANLRALSAFIEQMDMLRDDFQQFQNGNALVPYATVRAATVEAINAYDCVRDQLATLSPAELGGVDYRKIAHEIYCHVGQCCGDPMCFFSADECTQARWVEAVETVITHHLSTPRADESEWTDEQCLKFLSIAFRHGDFSGVTPDDIRMAVKMTAALSPPSPGAANGQL